MKLTVNLQCSVSVDNHKASSVFEQLVTINPL